MIKMFPAAMALAFAAIQPAAAATTVSNTNPITVVDGGETTSSIVVSGLTGNITSMSLTLNGLSHTYPDDLIFGLLNEELGLGFVFFSGVGGSIDISNINLTFSDAASGQLPESFVDSFPITSGTWLPSNFGAYEFTSYTNASSFADFSGFSPNATWTLFVDDVFPADGGSLSNGWSLSFETDAVAAVPEPGTWAMLILGFGAAGAGMRFRRAKGSRVAIA